MYLKFKDSSNQKNKKITLSVSFNYRSKKISWQMNIMERILIHNPTTHGHQLISCKYSFLNLIYICYVRTWIENILFKTTKSFFIIHLKKKRSIIIFRFLRIISQNFLTIYLPINFQFFVQYFFVLQ